MATRVVTENHILDGHVGLDLGCLAWSVSTAGCRLPRARKKGGCWSEPALK